MENTAYKELINFYLLSTFHVMME